MFVNYLTMLTSQFRKHGSNDDVKHYCFLCQKYKWTRVIVFVYNIRINFYILRRKLFIVSNSTCIIHVGTYLICVDWDRVMQSIKEREVYRIKDGNKIYKKLYHFECTIKVSVLIVYETRHRNDINKNNCIENHAP